MAVKLRLTRVGSNVSVHETSSVDTMTCWPVASSCASSHGQRIQPRTSSIPSTARSVETSETDDDTCFQSAVFQALPGDAPLRANELHILADRDNLAVLDMHRAARDVAERAVVGVRAAVVRRPRVEIGRAHV